MIGKISWYSPEKRFGFLTAQVDGKETKDYFFHQNDLINLCEPKTDDKCEFELGNRNGRVKAVQVVIVP